MDPCAWCVAEKETHVRSRNGRSVRLRPGSPHLPSAAQLIASMPLPDTVSSYASDFLHLREIADDLEKLKDARDNEECKQAISQFLAYHNHAFMQPVLDANGDTDFRLRAMANAEVCPKTFACALH